MITSKNYEEYMMMHADGELTAAEEQALMSFLYDHPELQSELAAFSMAKLSPDATEVYAAKDQLLKPEGGRKGIIFPHWNRYAIAAGVAAIVFFSVYKMSDNVNNDPTPIAKTETGKSNPVQTTPIVPETNTTIPTETVTPKSAHTYIAAAATTHTPKTESANSTAKPITHTTTAPEIQTASVAQQHTEITSIPTAEMVAFNTSVNNFQPTVTNSGLATININNTEEEKSFLDKLPIGELKKEGIEHVATALASRYDKINTLRQELTESTITLKVEKRKLIVSF
jgi:hypothetical protein